MRTSFLARRAFLALAIVFAPGPLVRAAQVQWNTPLTISGDADVSTGGTLVGAFNFGFTGVGATTVNGVSFAPFVLTGSSSVTIGNFTMSGPGFVFGGDNSLGSTNLPFSGLSSGYRALLSSGARTASTLGASYSLTMTGLTVGATYQFQCWSNSSLSEPGVTTATAGNAVTLDTNTTNADGGVGQHTIGSFVADGTAQVITFSSAGFPFVNGFQLRQTAPGNPNPPILSVRPAQVVEGDSLRQTLELGLPTLDFVLELDRPSPNPVTGTYSVRPAGNVIIIGGGLSSFPPATSGSYFTAGADFTEVIGAAFTIPAGSTSVTVRIPVFPDYLDEPDEYVDFRVDSLSGVGNLLIPTALGRIIDNDAPFPETLPTVSMRLTSVYEGTPPAIGLFSRTLMEFRVVLSAPSPAAITGVVNTAPLSGQGITPAQSGVDYLPLTNAFFGIPPGATSATILVQVTPDSEIEPRESLALTLSNIVGAQPASVTATGQIANDDGPPVISVFDASITEPSGGSGVFSLAQFRVLLSHPNYTADTTVKITTRNETALASSGGILRDYDPVATTLTIPPNTTLKAFQVPVRGDAVQEGTERFFVDFSNPVNATLPDPVAIGTILQSTQTTGLFALSSTGQRVAVDEVTPFAIEWTVPAGKVWRDLRSIDFRLRHGQGHAFWVRWDEASDQFTLVEIAGNPGKQHGKGKKAADVPSSGAAAGAASAPGSDAVLETKQARLHLASTSVAGSGPTGQTVTLHLAVSFPKNSTGHAYAIELAATGDDAGEDAFVQAGTVFIEPRGQR